MILTKKAENLPKYDTCTFIAFFVPYFIISSEILYSHRVFRTYFYPFHTFCKFSRFLSKSHYIYSVLWVYFLPFVQFWVNVDAFCQIHSSLIAVFWGLFHVFRHNHLPSQCFVFIITLLIQFCVYFGPLLSKSQYSNGILGIFPSFPSKSHCIVLSQYF